MGNPPINKIKNSKELINSLNNNKLLPYDFSKFMKDDYFVEIRPECFKISENQNAIKGKINRISKMGKEELVYLDFFGQEVCAILQTDDDLEEGQQISIEFKQKGFFIFDKNGKLQGLK